MSSWILVMISGVVSSTGRTEDSTALIVTPNISNLVIYYSIRKNRFIIVFLKLLLSLLRRVAFREVIVYQQLKFKVIVEHC